MTAFLSIAFTWHLPDALERARFYKACGYKVCVGGPATFLRKDFFGGIAESGGEYRDAISKHNPDATIASRGCPVGCWFCIVPKMEGRTFTLIPDFPVHRILCDNNLSALPVEYQCHILNRYKETGVPLLDANSGFEPRTFDDSIYARWKVVLKGPWRFAYDDQAEGKYVERVMHMLRKESPNRKRVYVLIGNEPFASCMERIQRVLAWGGEPHVQPFIKLNALAREPHVRFDWTRESLMGVARWANRRIWRYTPFEGYVKNKKTDIPEQYDSQQGLFL